MRCRSCGRALEADARFCPRCGSAVAAACAACGADLDPGARFCKQCGQAIEAPGPSDAGASAHPARERKVATLLFADIVGFTELGERLDAEVVSRLVSDAFERLSAEVERYGGTVEKFSGDAMLAVFGVPTIREDDAERAVRAALEMQAVMDGREDDGPRLRLRIGVESGEVLADLARTSTERDLFVTGDAVNTASRLQSVADPGTVVVGPATYGVTRGLIEYEPLPPHALKGKSLPVASWRAVRVRSRRGGLRTPLGLEAPLVGRDEELVLLKDSVRRTMADGRPHLLTVMGEAGAGKTRLVWELEKYLDGLPEVLHWRKGRCYSYASVSYSPLVEAVKADARISEDDPPAAMSQKLDARIDEVVVSQDASAVRTALRALLGLAGGEGIPQDELFEAWRSYLAAVAARHPLVLVAEDVHWADEATLDFLEFVARWGDAPMTVLCLARPELLERRAAWGGGIRNAALVQLSPLHQQEAEAMLDSLLGGALPDGVMRQVVEMAQGNPLFAEELVRMFVDQGLLRSRAGVWHFEGSVADSAIPSSVQAVLSARLDLLEAEEKRVAQEASVVGRTFWDVIVAHLRGRPGDEVARALHGLRLKELVAPRVPSTMAGASEWSFHHVLVRDVAYESLPKADRAVLHLQVAAWAEERLADRLDEFAELVAAHRLAAVRYRDELKASEFGGRSEEALLASTLTAASRAAHRASAIYDLREARHWQLVAIELAKRLERPPLERARLARDLRDLTHGQLDASENVSVLGEGVALLETLPRLDAGGRALLGELRTGLAEAIAQATGSDGTYQASQDLLRQVLAALEPDRPSAAWARACRMLAWILWHAYEFELAAPVAQQAMDEAAAVGDAATYREALHESGIVAAFQGDVESGLERLEESKRLAEVAGDRQFVARCAVNLPVIRLSNGFEVESIIGSLEPAVIAARRAGSYFTLAFQLNTLVAAYTHALRLEEALALREPWMDAVRRSGNPHQMGGLHAGMAKALLSLGRRGEAAAELREAEQTMTDDPQAAHDIPLLSAILAFDRDPAAALQLVDATRSDPARERLEAWELALWQARMAYRLGDGEQLGRAHEALSPEDGFVGPGRRLQRAWVDALSTEDPDALERVGDGLESLGYLWLMLEALVDVALVSARTGHAADPWQRVRRRCAELGYRPAFGPLPESRWAQAAQDRVTAY